MSVIRYKCTNCNREIELIEQPTGLETIGGCVITNRCRGRMYRLERLEDFAVGKFPSDVTGLTNYIKRNVLYDHTQAIADSVWLVEHDLGVNPSVQVLVNREELIDGVVVKSRLEIEPQSITLIDKNNLTIRFDRPESGLAQVIARSSAFTQTVETIDPGITYLPVSQSNILTIGIDCESGQFPAGTTAGLQLVRIYYLDQQTLDETAFESAVYKDYEARSPVSTSAWNDVSEIFVNGQIYTVMTIDIGDPVTDIGAPSAGTVLFQAGTSTSGFPYDQSPNMVVLLSNYPHANVDKNRNQLFRPDLNVGPALTLDSFIFAAGEISIDQTKIERVFPPIFSVSNPQTCPVPVVPVVPAVGAFVIVLGDGGSDGGASYPGSIYTSNDDITTWTGDTIGPNGPIEGAVGLVYAPSISTWVAVGTSGSQPYVYSTNDGTSWTLATRVDNFRASTASGISSSVAWSPALGLFVCGGLSDTGFIGLLQYSSDGITWTSSTYTTPGSSNLNQVSSVHWAADLNLFLCGTTDGEFAYSSDGQDSWTESANNPSGGSDIRRIYSVGSRVFAGLDNGTVRYTDDLGATAWSLATFDVAGSSADFGGIAANEDGSIIVAGGVGFNNGAYVWRSTNSGANFTRVDVNSQLTGAPFSQYAYGLIYDPDYGFIQVGRNASTNEQHIITSSDGEVWVTRLQSKLAKSTIGSGSPSAYSYGSPASVGSPQFTLIRSELQVVASKNQV